MSRWDTRAAEPVARLRATKVLDPYSQRPNGQLDWTNPARVVYPRCLIAPRTSDEPTELGRGAVITGYTIYMPEDCDVLPTDRLEFRGVTRDVDGEPGLWNTAGLVVNVKGVDG